MLTDAQWEYFGLGLTTPLRIARLNPDENGWLRVAVLMPKGAQLPADPGPQTCLVEFVCGQSMYKTGGKACFSRPGTCLRIPAGESFEISMTFTEALLFLSRPPPLRKAR